MLNDSIPSVSLGSWLESIVQLFNSTLWAIIDLPALRLLLSVLLFLVGVGLLALLVRMGKNEKR